MDQLAGVLLHVELVDTDGLLPAGLGVDGELAVADDGEIELGDLVGLGEVGVEVVLPVEPAGPGDLPVQGQAHLHGVLQHLLVDHRQGAGHAHAHRAAVGVGGAAELGGAGAEDLGLGGELHVGLQTDDSFPGHLACASFLAGLCL